MFQGVLAMTNDGIEGDSQAGDLLITQTCDEAQVIFTMTNGATNVPSAGTNGANGRDGNATNTRRAPW